MKKKPLPLIENVTITGVAAEGKAVARLDGAVLFVPFAVPGDVVDVQLVKKRHSFMEGYITRMVSPSPQRVPPFCEHYGDCGGCKWQPLPYAEQLRCKQQQVADQLERIGNLHNLPLRSILGAEQTTGYRNKLEFTFSHQRWLSKPELASLAEHPAAAEPALGFHIPLRFDKVLDIRQCHLQAAPSNEIRMFVKKFAVENELEFFDLREQTGLLRNLIIRTASTGEVMVIVVFCRRDDAKISLLMSALQREFPQLTSLLYIVNSKRNDSIADQVVEHFAGRDYVLEAMENLRFRVGAKSFYQTNSAQAYRLYSVVRELAQLSGTETVYDLYTGAGTIACFVAAQAGRVVGVECVPEAIDDARTNAQLNGIGNAVFYAGDMKDVLTTDFVQRNGKPDVLILDPPRAGIHPSVAQAVLNAQPTRIVYVSCNPATQARDLALLAARYDLTAVQPVDMFPHTHHVENVVRMDIKTPPL
jgi:23S rRNA (uracil1939-C5)-methyltransferase